MLAHSNTYRGFALADSDDLNEYNEYTDTSCVHNQLCLGGEFEENNFSCYDASDVGCVSAAVALCKKTAIFQVQYCANSTEPIFCTVAESDQSNNFMHPPFAIYLWPVAMVSSLTPPQLQNRCYPSG